MPDDFIAAEPPQNHAAATQKLVRLSDLFTNRNSYERHAFHFLCPVQRSYINFLSPLHGAAEVCPRRNAVLLEKAETYLHHRNLAAAKQGDFPQQN